jgi:hypothetical protein
MTPEKVAEYLTDKTIKEIKHHTNIWDMCVSEIIFTDGTVVKVAGGHGMGRFETITTASGEEDYICRGDG